MSFIISRIKLNRIILFDSQPGRFLLDFQTNSVAWDRSKHLGIKIVWNGIQKPWNHHSIILWMKGIKHSCYYQFYLSYSIFCGILIIFLTLMHGTLIALNRGDIETIYDQFLLHQSWHKSFYGLDRLWECLNSNYLWLLG